MKILIISCFLLVAGNAVVANDTVAPSMYLITCGTSNRLSASFGHTALRYCNPHEGVDLVFNFGTFNPGEPNFYLKFFRGKANYYLSETTYLNFVQKYQSENRTIWLQQIRIPDTIVCKIHDSLQHLILTENRFYHYNFFNNNCTTRVRDLLFSQIQNISVLDSVQKPSGKTWRQTLKPCLEGRPWFSVIVNLLAGPFTDKEITRFESMYLPQVFMNELQFLEITGAPEVVFLSATNPATVVSFITPMVVCWILLVLFVAEVFWINTPLKFSNRIDQMIFGISAAIGLVYLSLWLWSGHISLKFNLNMLWANPFNLLVVWSICARQNKLTRVYLVIFLLLLFFLLINFTRMPQKFPFETMPILSLLAFRSANQVFQFKTEKNVNNFQ